MHNKIWGIDLYFLGRKTTKKNIFFYLLLECSSQMYRKIPGERLLLHQPLTTADSLTPLSVLQFFFFNCSLCKCPSVSSLITFVAVNFVASTKMSRLNSYGNWDSVTQKMQNTLQTIYLIRCDVPSSCQFLGVLFQIFHK